MDGPYQLSHSPSDPRIRSLFLHNIDETWFIQGLRVGDWKIVKGNFFVMISLHFAKIALIL